MFLKNKFICKNFNEEWGKKRKKGVIYNVMKGYLFKGVLEKYFLSLNNAKFSNKITHFLLNVKVSGMTIEMICNREHVFYFHF